MNNELPKCIKPQLDRLIHIDDTVAIAVSGGSDSVGLLHLLAHYLPPQRLRVVFVDHGLRAGVDAEWSMVKEMSDSLHVPAKRWKITDEYAKSETGEGIQQWARHRRYAKFIEAVETWNASALATGHTLDDQAETVILRLLRGTGLDGLSAIRVERPLTERCRVIRPLLDVRRSQIREWLKAKGIDWTEDPSNKNQRFARVQTRNLLPEMVKLNPHIAAHLAALATEAQFAGKFINENINANSNVITLLYANGVKVKQQYFESVPTPLWGRVVRVALEHKQGNLLRFDRKHIESITQALMKPLGTKQFDLPGDLVAYASYGDLYVFDRSKLKKPVMESQKLVLTPSNQCVGGSEHIGVRLTIGWQAADEKNEVPFPFSKWEIRLPKAGDRLYGSERKMARILIEHRIPTPYRPWIPVLANETNEIIAAPGLLKSRISGLHMDWHFEAGAILNDLALFAEK